jgi:serine/threonine protein kinase
MAAMNKVLTFLRSVTEDGTSVEHALPPGNYTLGQGEDCPVRLSDPSTSRHHARLTIAEDGFMLLEDLGSTNGTFVDGVPVTAPHPVRPSQTITLGALPLSVSQNASTPEKDGSGDFDPTLPAKAVAAVSPATNLVEELPAELTGDQRYEVIRPIAQGGMGAVMAALQPSIRREVAMKTVLSGMDSASRMRFIEEAQITGQLEHPNIVPIHELGVDGDGQLFYTMKLVKGITLHEAIESLRGGKPGAAGQYPLPVLLTIFQKVCDAVAFAHSHHVIHRDLKPANIMLGEFGEVLVMDWGLAKVINLAGSTPTGLATGAKAVAATGKHAVTSARSEQPDTFSTMDGHIMGTPQFMSPEQVRGETSSLDERSDVFALGAILYQMLTLHPPFTGADVQEVIDRVAQGRFTNPAALDAVNLPHMPGGRVPDSLKAVVKKALAPSRALRYTRVLALQEDLAAYQGGFATTAEKAGAWRQLSLLVKRNKAASIGLAAVLLVGSTLGTKAVIDGRRAERALADLKKTAPALLSLAEMESGFQRFDSAVEKLDAALALDPALTAARWRRAWGLLALERFEDCAEELRKAMAEDPAKAKKLGAILPVVETLAQSPSNERWNPLRSKAVLDHLNTIGASGEAIALSSRFQLSGQDKQKLVQTRLGEWLGKDANGNPKSGGAGIAPDGSLSVGALPAAITSLEPLRGLPINRIDASQTKIESLEPLVGMPLHTLIVERCSKIKDLSPLKGMRLIELNIKETQASDLSPLAGMPLKSLILDSTKVADLGPLEGLPLEKLSADKHSSFTIRDLSPLEGMPLKSLKLMGQQPYSLSPLQGMRLQLFNNWDGPPLDLSPLRGMPLKVVSANSEDFSPLQEMDLSFFESTRPSDQAIQTMAGLQSKSMLINGSAIKNIAPLANVRCKILHLQHCGQLRDLSPMRECAGLEELVITGCPGSPEPLRGHPTLKRISFSRDQTVNIRPVAEFWAEYDAKNPKP